MHDRLPALFIICASRRAVENCNTSINAIIKNKSSAVAETGDRARAMWAEKWVRAAMTLSVGVGSHLTRYGLSRGLHPFQVAS